MAEPLLPAELRSGTAAPWPRRSCTFPAKLWLLVNSPHVRSVRWDDRGAGLLIDQALFERELLGGAHRIFKTENFGSIVRQLNLYGFRKLPAGSAGAVGPGLGPAAERDSPDGPRHHFWNPHFCHNRPDLLVRINRLTKANKEKLVAGLKVPCLLLDGLQHMERKAPAAAAAAVGPRRAQWDRVPVDYSSSKDLKLRYTPNDPYIKSATGIFRKFPVAKMMCGHVFSL